MKLYTPGPLEYYPWVREAMKKVLHHRSPEFSEMVQNIQNNLSTILQSHPPIMLNCSATGAMNSLFQNFIDTGKKSLVLSNGKFGDRILNIMNFYGIDPTVIRAPLGEIFKKSDMPDDKFDYMFMTALETSTGTKNNFEEITKHLKEKNPDVKVFIDGVSAFGTYPIHPEDQGIDALVFAPHKSMGCPPGISFIWYDKNLKFQKKKDFYFDLKVEEEKQLKKSQFRFTPPTEIVSAINESLNYIVRDLEGFVELHEKRARVFRDEMKKLGLKQFSQNPSNNLTTVKVENVEGVIKGLKEKGYLISKGGDGAVPFLRISHMGDVKDSELRDIVKLINEYAKN